MRSIWLSFGCYWCFFLSIPIRLDFQWTFCFAVDSIWIYRYSIYLFECIEWNWLRCKWNWWFCRGSAYNLSLSLTQTYTPNIDSKQIFLYMHMREIVLLFWIIMFYFLVQYWWIWFTLLRSNSMALDRQMVHHRLIHWVLVVVFIFLLLLIVRHSETMQEKLVWIEEIPTTLKTNHSSNKNNIINYENRQF